MKRLLFWGLLAIFIFGTSCNLQQPVVSVETIKQQQTIKLIPIERMVEQDTIGIGNVKVWVGSNEGLFTGGGYYQGATAEYTIPIYNGYSVDKQVLLIVEPSPKLTRVFLSDGTEDWNYQPAPPDIIKWVSLEDSRPIIPARSMREILVTLKMPKLEDKNAYVWFVTNYGEKRLEGMIAAATEASLKELPKASGKELQNLVLLKLNEHPESRTLLLLKTPQTERKLNTDTRYLLELQSEEIIQFYDIRKDKWEFRITVVAIGQGYYETAVSQRWLVTMR